MTPPRISVRVKEFMFDHNLTQAQMAEAIGISTMTLWKILRSRGYDPSERIIAKINRLVDGTGASATRRG